MSEHVFTTTIRRGATERWAGVGMDVTADADTDLIVNISQRPAKWEVSIDPATGKVSLRVGAFDLDADQTRGLLEAVEALAPNYLARVRAVP